MAEQNQQTVEQMAESSTPGIHLSIRVQSGPHCLLSKIFFTPLCVSFAGLFLRVCERDSRVSEQHVLEKALISDKSGNGGMEVDSGSPVSLCEEFNAKYVTFFVSMGNSSACEVQPAQQNAFCQFIDLIFCVLCKWIVFFLMLCVCFVILNAIVLCNFFCASVSRPLSFY